MAARQGNMEMVKYCVANECPTVRWNVSVRVAVISRYSNTYEEAKTSWDYPTPLWRLIKVISPYSNTLLSVSMINLTNGRVSWRPRTVI